MRPCFTQRFLLTYMTIWLSLKVQATFSSDVEREVLTMKRPKRTVGLKYQAIPQYKWPLPILYKISSRLSADSAQSARSSVDQWSSLTCVTFEEIPESDDLPDKQHLIFTHDEVGVQNGMAPIEDTPPPQGIQVDDGHPDGYTWKYLGITLGMTREHTSLIRDSMVTIDYDNVYPGYEAYFDKLNPSYYTVHDVPYDYGSLYHENYYWLSRAEYAATIVPNLYSHFTNSMGQLHEITFADAMWVNRAYCAGVCSEELPCENGGYTDPLDCSVCRCPDGYAGDLCTGVPEGSADCNAPSGEYELTEEMPELCVRSPNFNKQQVFTSGDQCTWRFKTNETCRIQLWSDSTRGYLRQYSQGWCGDWLEIKYLNGHDHNGERWCGQWFENTTKLTSDRNTVTAAFRSFPRNTGEDDQFFTGFSMCFAVDPTCFNPENPTTTPDTPTTAESAVSTGSKAAEMTTGAGTGQPVTTVVTDEATGTSKSSATTTEKMRTSTILTSTGSNPSTTTNINTGSNQPTTTPASSVSVSSSNNTATDNSPATTEATSGTTTPVVKEKKSSDGTDTGAVVAIVVVLIVGLIVLGLLFGLVYWITRPRDPNEKARKRKVAPRME